MLFGLYCTHQSSDSDGGGWLVGGCVSVSEWVSEWSLELKWLSQEVAWKDPWHLNGINNSVFGHLGGLNKH